METFMRQRLRAIKAAQRAYNKRVNPYRDIIVVSGVLIVSASLIAFWIGRQTINLSDLSQQRARDIAVAVYQECDRNFGKDAIGLTAISRMSNRCNNVADLALELIYAAGVEAEDRVLEKAKQMAREAKQ